MRALVAEIRRLNAIVECAGDLARAQAREADDYAEYAGVYRLLERRYIAAGRPTAEMRLRPGPCSPYSTGSSPRATALTRA